jgi:cobalamin biosynthesis protein CobT
MSSLSVQDEVITLYLTPLLNKHNHKQEIHWEDLSQAKQAADGFLSQAPKSKETEQASDALLSLHKSQIIAYREQATTSLQEWCQTTWKLPAIVDSESQDAYSQRCLQKAFEERPFWKLGTGILQKILSPIIKERAASSFADYINKQQQQQSQQQLENDAAAVADLKAKEADDQVDGKEEGNQEEDGEMEEDDNEDGEMDDDGGEEEGEDGEDGQAANHEEEEEEEEGEEGEAKDGDNTSQTKQLLAKKTKNQTGKKRIVTKKTIQRKKKVSAASTTSDAANKPKKSAPWTGKRGRGGGAAGGSNRASS